MQNRHDDREQWEILFIKILMSYRPISFIGGLIILGYAPTVLIVYPIAAAISLGLAFFMFLFVFSDQVALCVARIGTWIATIGKGD